MQLEKLRKQIQTRNAQKSENGSKPAKSGEKVGSTAPAEINNGKEGSTTPNFNSDLGDGGGDGDGDGVFDEKEAVSPHLLEKSTEKRVTKPLMTVTVMAMMMAMAMVMEFGEAGVSKGAPID